MTQPPTPLALLLCLLLMGCTQELYVEYGTEGRKSRHCTERPSSVIVSEDGLTMSGKTIRCTYAGSGYMRLEEFQLKMQDKEFRDSVTDFRVFP